MIVGGTAGPKLEVPPCTMNVDCPEPVAKPERELTTSISCNVHVHHNTPFEAVNHPNTDHAWLTIGNAGCALHVDAHDARRLAKALTKLALAAEHGRVFKAEF